MGVDGGAFKSRLLFESATRALEALAFVKRIAVCRENIRAMIHFLGKGLSLSTIKSEPSPKVDRCHGEGGSGRKSHGVGRRSRSASVRQIGKPDIA